MKKKILIAIFISSLVIRVFCIFFFANTADPQMWEFGKIARSLIAGDGFRYTANFIDVPSAYMPPGLPFIYYAFFKIFGDASNTYILILLLNALLASANVIIIYKIAEIIYNSKIAILSAAYAALSPIFVFSTINYNSIIIYQLLIGLSLLFYLKHQKLATIAKNVPKLTNLKYTLFLSITLGIFLYFRSEIFGFTVILCIYLLSKKMIQEALLILIVTVIIISPWSVRNYLTFGKIIPVSTSIGYNFYIGHGDDYSTIEFNRRILSLKEDSTYEIEKSRIGFEEAFKFISEHPKDEIKESFSKVISLWIIDKYRENSRSPVYILTWLPTILLFFIGYIKSLKDKNMFHKLLFMNLYIIFSTVLVIVFINIPRYQIQMSFIMVPTAMYGLLSIYRYLSLKKPALKT